VRPIFWYSNSPATPTGYGTQTAQVVRRLKKRGHKVAVHANWGHINGVGKWNGVTILPAGYDSFSQDNLWSHYNWWAKQTGAEPLIITLCDVWVLKNPAIQEHPVVSWTPVDHANLVPEVHRWLAKPTVTPVAMSQHGSDAMTRGQLEHVYIPHALEKHWKPSPLPEDPWPGRFVVTIPNANKGVLPSRKAWGENILAFSIFAKDHPEALLYLHTDAKPQHGIDLPALLKASGVKSDQVLFVEQYDYRMGVDDTTMARIYTRSDVLLSATAGEGFGLPVLEAQACGTRVIVSNFSAQPELVGDGWVVQVQPQWNPTQLGFFCTPLIHSIVEGLESAWQAWREHGGHSEQAVEFAKQYDADRWFDEGWVPLLDSLS
jgi:glycosyltransferase involved in cell wall biosynthesis